MLPQQSCRPERDANDPPGGVLERSRDRSKRRSNALGRITYAMLWAILCLVMARSRAADAQPVQAIPVNNTPNLVPLGSWDAVSNAFGPTCLEAVPHVTAGGQTHGTSREQLRVTLVRSRAHASYELDLSAALGVRGLMFSASAQASLLDRISTDSTSVSLVISGRYEALTESVQSVPTLGSRYTSLSDGDFRATCGTHFVSSRTRGAAYYGILTLTSSDQSTTQRIRAELDGSYALATLAAKVTSLQTRGLSAVSVSLSIETVGFSSRRAPVRVSDLASLPEAINALQTDAQNFLEEAARATASSDQQAGLGVLWVGVRPYARASASSQERLMRIAETSVMGIAELWERARARRVELTAANPQGCPFRDDQLRSAVQQVDSDLRLLVTIASHCARVPLSENTAVAAECQVPEDLRLRVTQPAAVQRICELCNGVDDDLDGTIDEQDATRGCVDLAGRAGELRCVAGEQGAQLRCHVQARAESCNGVDDNLDGVVDEGCDHGVVLWDLRTPNSESTWIRDVRSLRFASQHRICQLGVPDACQATAIAHTGEARLDHHSHQIEFRAFNADRAHPTPYGRHVTVLATEGRPLFEIESSEQRREYFGDGRTTQDDTGHWHPVHCFVVTPEAGRPHTPPGQGGDSNAIGLERFDVPFMGGDNVRGAGIQCELGPGRPNPPPTASR